MWLIHHWRAIMAVWLGIDAAFVLWRVRVARKRGAEVEELERMMFI